MALEGGWMSRYLTRQPIYSEWTTASTLHTETGMDKAVDPRREDNIIEAPTYQGGGSGESLEPIATTGQFVDKTPVTHYSPYVGRQFSGDTGYVGQDTDLKQFANVHASNLGADRAQIEERHDRMTFGDTYHVDLTRDMTAPPDEIGATDRHDLVVGLNAFPQNNPPHPMYQGEGWRRALWQKVYVLRTPSSDINVQNQWPNPEFRIISQELDVARTVKDAPGVGGPYAASWSTLARWNIGNDTGKPLMRRAPDLVGQAQETDGTDMPSTNVGDFV